MPAVIVRMAKPSTPGICEKRHSVRTTSSTATPNVQPCRRANRENWLDGSGSVVTTPSNAVTLTRSSATRRRVERPHGRVAGLA